MKLSPFQVWPADGVVGGAEDFSGRDAPVLRLLFCAEGPARWGGRGSPPSQRAWCQAGGRDRPDGAGPAAVTGAPGGREGRRGVAMGRDGADGGAAARHAQTRRTLHSAHSSLRATPSPERGLPSADSAAPAAAARAAPHSGRGSVWAFWSFQASAAHPAYSTRLPHADPGPGGGRHARPSPIRPRLGPARPGPGGPWAWPRP
jgi:hypothetical protein